MSKRSGTQVVRKAAPIFAALGDPTRLELVSRLIDGQARSITQLSKGLSLTRQAVTRHLKTLERAGIVKSKAVGRESQFLFVTKPIDEARSYLDQVSAQWDDAVRRLQAFVETERH